MRIYLNNDSCKVLNHITKSLKGNDKNTLCKIFFYETKFDILLVESYNVWVVLSFDSEKHRFNKFCVYRGILTSEAFHLVKLFVQQMVLACWLVHC